MRRFIPRTVSNIIHFRGVPRRRSIEDLNRSLAEHINKVQDIALRESLTFHNERIAILNADPKSRFFLLWFTISCYFPVITACLGPIANTISIACVVEKWRYVGIRRTEDEGANHYRVSDSPGIFAVNILSLVFGFISNIILVLHFAKKLNYFTAQILNLFGWTTAGLLLMIDVIVSASTDFPENYHKSIGFWYACITSGLYLGCTLTLSIHFIGYALGRYPATFNLLPRERSIMMFTVWLSIWLIWGAGMFSGLIGVSYGNALYFCTVSLLTIGLGDILPNSIAAKIMILIFAVTGVLILGLIVFMTRSIIQKSAGPIFYFHRVERSRSKLWSKIREGDLNLTEEESFEMMMKIRKLSKKRQQLFSLMSTVTIFAAFWLLGALVLMFAEGWSYFDCMYFCFLCLLTIGYGSDFAPKTAAGRAFFVIWAIGAVPLMTAILSTVGDILYELTTTMDKLLGDRFGHGIKYMIFQGTNARDSQLVTSGHVVNESDAEEVASAMDDANISEDLDDQEELAANNDSYYGPGHSDEAPMTASTTTSS